eukprot:g16010.t1
MLQELGSYFTAKKYESLPICKEKAVKDGVAYLETFYFVRERVLGITLDDAAADVANQLRDRCAELCLSMEEMNAIRTYYLHLALLTPNHVKLPTLGGLFQALRCCPSPSLGCWEDVKSDQLPCAQTGSATQCAQRPPSGNMREAGREEAAHYERLPESLVEPVELLDSHECEVRDGQTTRDDGQTTDEVDASHKRSQYFEHVLDRSLAQNSQLNAYQDVEVGPFSEHIVLDWNGDGAEDVVVLEDSERFHLYEFHEGSVRTVPRVFENITSLGENPYPYQPYPAARAAFADWDQDGDVDLIFSSQADGKLHYHEMISGSWTSEDAEHPFSNISLVNHPQPVVVDWDNDGDMDLFLGPPDGRFFEQLADGTLHEWPLEQSPVKDLVKQGDLAWRVLDCDADGDFDLLRLRSNHEQQVQACEHEQRSPHQLGTLRCDDDFLCLGTNLSHFKNSPGGPLEGLGDLLHLDLGDLKDGRLKFISVHDNAKGAVLWSAGFCVPSDPCHQRGFCLPRATQCSCVAGHELGDCSGCEPHFYSEQAQVGQMHRCKACPGADGQVCYGRGLCFDDAAAKAAAAAAALQWQSSTATLIAQGRIPISDLSAQGEKLLVTTSIAHFLLSRPCNVTFARTGVPDLESSSWTWRVKATSYYHLALEGEKSSMPLDTSKGHLHVKFPQLFVSAGFARCPLIGWCVFFLAATVGTALQLTWRFSVVLGALGLCTGSFCFALRRRQGTRTPLAKRRHEFLQEWQPLALQRCSRGPDRSMSAGKLQRFVQFFDSFIKERSMYYVCSNIVKPLTKPFQLMHDGTLVGSYWAPRPDRVWCPCRLQSVEGGGVSLIFEDGERWSCSEKELQELDPVQDGQLDGVEDICTLSIVTEAALLYSVRARYFRQEIYTRVARILISVNPFRALPIYSARHRDAGGAGGEEERAIVISGESGAGKTESAKFLLSYVAECVKGHDGQDGLQGLEGRVLQTNPILESFGNAMTTRNANSSRFGKWLDLRFSEALHMRGGQITSYLLEVTRVCGQSEGERGFHIFFQLLQAKRSLPSLGLQEPSHYRYLKNSTLEAPGIDDAEDFAKLRQALQQLGFSEEEQMQAFQILAGILNLGNCDFYNQEEEDRDAELGLDGESFVAEAARKLKLCEAKLRSGLLRRTVVTGRDEIETFLRLDQARAARDGLARMLYGRLFDWLIRRMNATLAMSNGGHRSGDGGRFATNSLEQLLINLSNEQLQLQFNEAVFKSEIEDCLKEGVDLGEAILYEDNSDVELTMPKATDSTFANKVLKGHGATSRLIAPKFQGSASFGIQHYAATVMLAAGSPQLGAAPATYRFRSSLRELMTKIFASETHYVRCIKPNAANRPEARRSGDVFGEGRNVTQVLKFTKAAEWQEIKDWMDPRLLDRFQTRAHTTQFKEALQLYRKSVGSYCSNESLPESSTWRESRVWKAFAPTWAKLKSQEAQVLHYSTLAEIVLGFWLTVSMLMPWRQLFPCILYWQFLRQRFQAEPGGFWRTVLSARRPHATGFVIAGTFALQEVLENVYGKDLFALQGKVALITGASNGLGLENARCLMKYGCHVIWAVRSPDKAASVLNQLEKKEKLTGKATILKIELSDLSSVKPFVESFLALNLPLHYLICNAGIMSPTEWLPSKQGFELQFATNNLSHFLLTELLMPKLKETAKTGEVRVVILSSLAASDLCVSPANRCAGRPARDLCTVMGEVTMRWQRKAFTFRDETFQVEHFDVAEAESSSSGDDEESLQARLQRRKREAQLQRCEAELGACLWSLKAQFEWRSSYRGLRTLELGAGAGACGIALAYDGATSTVSDVEALLPLLQRNLELNELHTAEATGVVPQEEKTGSSRRRNKPTRSTMKGSCQAVAVEWEKEALHPTLPEKAFDLIVVCDCLYENRDSWAALQLLLERLPAEASGEPSGEPAVLLASAALRKPFLEAFVAQLAKAGFTLLQKQEGGHLGEVCTAILQPPKKIRTDASSELAAWAPNGFLTEGRFKAGFKVYAVQHESWVQQWWLATSGGTSDQAPSETLVQEAAMERGQSSTLQPISDAAYDALLHAYSSQWRLWLEDWISERQVVMELPTEQDEEVKAAITVQRHYRAHKARQKVKSKRVEVLTHDLAETMANKERAAKLFQHFAGGKARWAPRPAPRGVACRPAKRVARAAVDAVSAATRQQRGDQDHWTAEDMSRFCTALWQQEHLPVPPRIFGLDALKKASPRHLEAEILMRKEFRRGMMPWNQKRFKQLQKWERARYNEVYACPCCRERFRVAPTTGGLEIAKVVDEGMTPGVAALTGPQAALRVGIRGRMFVGSAARKLPHPHEVAALHNQVARNVAQGREARPSENGIRSGADLVARPSWRRLWLAATAPKYQVFKASPRQRNQAFAKVSGRELAAILMATPVTFEQLPLETGQLDYVLMTCSAGQIPMLRECQDDAPFTITSRRPRVVCLLDATSEVHQALQSHLEAVQEAKGHMFKALNHLEAAQFDGQEGQAQVRLEDFRRHVSRFPAVVRLEAEEVPEAPELPLGFTGPLQPLRRRAVRQDASSRA